MKLCTDTKCAATPRGLGRTGTTVDYGGRGTLKNHKLTSDTPLYLITTPFEQGLKCILRVRYNISSGDFDGWNGFSAADNGGGHIGATGDPSADFVGLGQLKSGPLELSVNTGTWGMQGVAWRCMKTFLLSLATDLFEMLCSFFLVVFFYPGCSSIQPCL